MSTNYAQPDSLVNIGWVLEHLNDPKVKLVEVDVDTTSYEKGHIKGAIGWNWQTQLQDKVTRNVVDDPPLLSNIYKGPYIYAAPRSGRSGRGGLA